MSVDRAAISRIVGKIASGQSAQDRAMDIRGYRSGYVLIPTAWDAADLAFKAADTDDSASEIRKTSAPGLSTSVEPTYSFIRRDAASAPLLRVTNIPTSGGGWMPLPAALFQGHSSIKVVSTNTANEDAASQTANRTLIFRFSS
jgi:hypothetical protein